MPTEKNEGEHSRKPFAPYFVVAMEWLISKVRDILYAGTIFYHATENALSQNFLLVVLRSRGYLSVVDNGVVHFQSVPHLKWAGDFWEFLVTWEFYKQVRIRRKIYKMAVVDSFKNERFLAGS